MFGFDRVQQVAPRIDQALHTSQRVHTSLPVARVPAALQTRSHEIYKYIAVCRFLAKGSGGFSKADCDVMGVLTDAPYSSVLRTCGDFVARYGLKAMSMLKSAAQQTAYADSDVVFIDGSRVCRRGRDVVILDSEGIQAVCIHQLMADSVAGAASEGAARATEASFLTTESVSARATRCGIHKVCSMFF